MKQRFLTGYLKSTQDRLAEQPLTERTFQRASQNYLALVNKTSLASGASLVYAVRQRKHFWPLAGLSALGFGYATFRYIAQIHVLFNLEQTPTAFAHTCSVALLGDHATTDVRAAEKQEILLNVPKQSIATVLAMVPFSWPKNNKKKGRCKKLRPVTYLALTLGALKLLAKNHRYAQNVVANLATLAAKSSTQL